MNHLDSDELWRAVVERDARRDGEFYFGVVTTGIFCRPSCRSRRPRRKNVRFFRTPTEARIAGLRACRRCHPAAAVEPEVEVVAEVCRYLREHHGDDAGLDLASLSGRTGRSAAALRRLFRRHLGLTPAGYLEACRLEAFRRHLRAGTPITDAVYEVGYGSSSRLYERLDSRFGMTPTEYLSGGEGLDIRYAFLEAGELGLLLVAATPRGLCWVGFGDDRHELLAELSSELPAGSVSASPTPSHDPELRLWCEALTSHLEGREPHLDLPTDVRCTAFRARVWRYLQSIPAGETRTYGEVATALGNPRGARAVAQSCAGNRLALVIPCHRVIRGDGDPGGYRWSAERKRRLLEREARFNDRPETSSGRVRSGAPPRST